MKIGSLISYSNVINAKYLGIILTSTCDKDVILWMRVNNSEIFIQSYSPNTFTAWHEVNLIEVINE